MKELLEIINYPNPILRQKSREVKKTELKAPEFLTWLEQLKDTMLEKDGAGLAAPQTGKNIRAVAVRLDFDSEESILMINPKIVKKSWAKKTEEEGCLSVLKKDGTIIYAPVCRPEKIVCHYHDHDFNLVKIEAEGLIARAIQHEIDHLDGVMFIDRISDPKIKKDIEEYYAKN